MQMIMRKRTERIHIRATKATKARWESFCYILDENSQCEAFDGLMKQLTKRILYGDEILKDIRSRNLKEKEDEDKWDDLLCEVMEIE